MLRPTLMVLSVVCILNLAKSTKACDQPGEGGNKTGTSGHADCPLEKLLNQLQDMKHPVVQRTADCVNELEMADAAVRVAIQEKDAAAFEVSQSAKRLKCAVALLQSMCQTISVDGVAYSREDVANAMCTLLDEFKQARKVLGIREEILAKEQANARAIEVRVANWKRVERELLGQITLLLANHDLQNAESAEVAATQQQKLARAERLVTEIREMLPATAQTETVATAKLDNSELPE
ncbi:MAG: hypothetical protein KDA66_13180, partial [Planctomycetaceae bacterium]|nr:hypothetical protein [Planctomycetaceae bacterium]